MKKVEYMKHALGQHIYEIRGWKNAEFDHELVGHRHRVAAWLKAWYYWVKFKILYFNS